jgi:hypothetical protein
MSLTFELKNIQPGDATTDDRKIIIKSEPIINTSEISIEDLYNQLIRLEADEQSIIERKAVLIAEMKELVKQTLIKPSSKIVDIIK